MKWTIRFGVALTALLMLGAWVQKPAGSVKDELAIGEKAPLTDVQMKDVSGKMISLEQAADENGLLVIFSCNTCPWVARWEDRYPEVHKLAQERKIGMILLNPNEAYRNKGDSFEDMVNRAREKDYSFYYALDRNHKLADAFGAMHTPHVYLFGKDMKLAYRGAIDDNARSAADVKEPWLKNAIKAMAGGEEINPRTTKSLGCSIKRVK